MGKTAGVAKTKTVTTKGTKPGKKAPRKPYAKYHKREHSALIRARLGITSARSREVDTVHNELLHRELTTVTLIAELKAALGKRSQVTYEDIQWAIQHSGTAFGVFV